MSIYMVREIGEYGEWVEIDAWDYRDAAETFAQEGETDRGYWEIQPGDGLEVAVLKAGDPPENERRYKLDKEYEPSWFVEKRTDKAAKEAANG